MASEQRFQVDLQGLIELLSEHLYSGPDVVVREMIQNGLDACAMRGDRAGDERPACRLDAREERLDCYDSGVGITSEDVDRFLATVGRSAKRDEWGLARADTIGQFGIGLLSGFLVSDEIVLASRPAGADEIVEWRAQAGGTYGTVIFPSVDAWARQVDPAHVAWLTQGPGTVVRLVAKAGAERSVAPERVVHLARSYARFAPVPVVVDTPDGERTINEARPWELSPQQRSSWAWDHWQFPVLASFTVTVPEVDARGVCYIADMPLSPGLAPQHLVSIKGLTVVDGEADILPPWGFFARVVIDAAQVHPTASREQLRSDDALEALRTGLAGQLTRWLTRTAASDPDTMARFLTHHGTGLTAMAAAADEDDFATLAGLVPFDTTRGELTLPDLFDATVGPVGWVRTVGEYNQIAPVAAAEGQVVVNGGYVYCADLLSRCERTDPWRGRLARITPAALRDRLRPVDPQWADRAAGLEIMASDVLAEAGVRVSVRRFEPRSVAAVLLDDAASAQVRDARNVASTADPLFAGLIDAVTDPGDHRPEVVLNASNATVRALADVTDDAVMRPSLQAIYARALLLGRHATSAADQRLIDRAFAGLLNLVISQERE